MWLGFMESSEAQETGSGLSISRLWIANSCALVLALGALAFLSPTADPLQSSPADVSRASLSGTANSSKELLPEERLGLALIEQDREAEALALFLKAMAAARTRRDDRSE